MATQRIDRRTDLVSVQSIAYIRAINVNFSAAGCKPNTILFPFFDGTRVDDYVSQTGSSTRGYVTTDANGSVSGTFHIPGFRFTTGTKEFVLSESQSLSDNAILGMTTGTAKASFYSNGIRNIFQETVTTTNTTEVINIIRVELHIPLPVPVWVDPVAQSFNTYGVTGGCFVTHIDLYFGAKPVAPAAQIPVSVEIREMVNGYPSPKLTSADARVFANPSAVNVDTTGNTSTRFVFPKMIYLDEDKEYCFVVQSNSNKYELFMSTIGENDLATGKRVFEQPYLGSLFKSQNNSTWTPDQFSDLKFNLAIAQFDTNTQAVYSVKGTAGFVAIPSTAFSTNSTSTVTVKLPYRHGLGIGYKVQLITQTDSVYNGIPGASLNGTFNVTAVASEYEFSFVAGAAATSTGPILTGGTLQEIYVDDGGSGYTSAPTVVISGNATGTAVIRDGKLVRVDITNKGSGYTSAPVVTVAGAVCVASIDQKIGVGTNRLAHSINPAVSHFVPSGAALTASVIPLVYSSVGSLVTDQAFGSALEFAPDQLTHLNANVLLMSRANEIAKLGGAPSSKLQFNLSSTNKNVSPVIDTSSVKAMFGSNVINTSNIALASEVSPTTGLAEAKYVTKRNTLETISTSAKVFVTAYSSINTSVDVFIRTTLSSNSLVHEDQNWVLLTCDVPRNKSSTKSQVFEYVFYQEEIPAFDVFDIKIVLTSSVKHDAPVVVNYRAIMSV